MICVLDPAPQLHTLVRINDAHALKPDSVASNAEDLLKAFGAEQSGGARASEVIEPHIPHVPVCLTTPQRALREFWHVDSIWKYLRHAFAQLCEIKHKANCAV